MTFDKSLKEFMAVSQARAEEALDDRLPEEARMPERLHQAMRYSALGGGKRLRPLLTYATGIALGVPLERLDGPASAVEMIHVYSLIHDDLPAMDDDSLRRGKPTSHIAFDEATAILAGDGLQALAFHVLATDPTMKASADQRIAMVECLATASGSYGMVGGQAIDLHSVGKQLDLPALENMHIRKTGALIRASVRLAAIAKDEGDHSLREQLDHYAQCIGLSFQIKDDILDEESDTQTLGKTQGKDRDNNKPNYPTLLGMAGAKEKAQDMHEAAIDSLKTFGPEADLLRQLSQFIIDRKN